MLSCLVGVFRGWGTKRKRPMHFRELAKTERV